MKALKMFTIHNIVQHNRLVRLVILMIIIGLTIFLYTSYYANSTLDRLPALQRLHMPLISVSSILNEDKENPSFQRHNGSDERINANIIHTKPMKKTKAENGSDIGNLSDVAIAQQSSSVGDFINTSFTSQQQFGDPSSFLALAASSEPLASIQNSNDTMLPATSNVMPVGKVQQNLIEAIEQQKLLQSVSTGGTGTKSNSNNNNIDQNNNNNSNNNNNNINNNNDQHKNKTIPDHLDTSKGIRTSDLYESGHSLANSELCGSNAGEHVRLLILITSAPTHRDARLAIRQTWGHYATRRDIAMAFILGATNVQSIEDSLEAESYMYSDIIRGRFFDSYNNLTLKTISSLEWVDTYCSRAAFILKTDDDMFINVQRLMSFIDKHRSDDRIIYGRLAKKWKPIRNKRSKYYVSPQQYFPSVFPQFTTGPAYLISGSAIHDLYLKSLVQTYLKLEDVFTTGIVAQLVNVKRVHINEFLNRRIAFNPCNLRKAISVHMVKANEQFDLWKKLLDTNTKCK